MDASEARAREIGRRILDYIRESRLKAGDRLPSEAEMANHLGISRPMIREVYVRLVAEGLIVRRHGLGTFVGRVPIKDDQTRQSGFAASILAAGMEPTVEIVATGRTALTEEQAVDFACPSGTGVTRFERLFRADGNPVVLIEDVFAPGIDAEAIDLDRYAMDMIAGLATVTDMRDTRIDTWVTATNLSDDKAALLELPSGFPAIHIYSAIRRSAGETVSVAWAWLNPQLIELKSSRSVNVSDTAAVIFASQVSPVTRRVRAEPPLATKGKGT